MAGSKKYVTTYRGVDIFIDYDNIYHIILKGKDQEFETLEAAEDYIDETPATIRYNHSPVIHRAKMYFIYVKGTYKNHRAKYLRRNGKSEYCNESDADKFPEKRMRAILKNSSHYDSYPSKF